MQTLIAAIGLPAAIMLSVVVGLIISSTLSALVVLATVIASQASAQTCTPELRHPPRGQAELRGRRCASNMLSGGSSGIRGAAIRTNCSSFENRLFSRLPRTRCLSERAHIRAPERHGLCSRIGVPGQRTRAADGSQSR